MWQGHSYTRPSSAESRFKFRCDPGYITESGKAVTVHMGHNQICDLSGCPTKPSHELISPTASKVEKWGGDNWKGARRGTTRGCPQSWGWTVGPTLPCPRTGVLTLCTPPPRRIGSTPSHASLGLRPAGCPAEFPVTRRMGQGYSPPTGAPAAVVAAAAAAQAIAQPLPGAPRWASASFLAARAGSRSMDGRHRSGTESHGDLSLGDAGLDWEGARPHPGMETWSWPAPPLLSPWPSQQAAQVRFLSRACAMVPGPRRCGQCEQKLLEVLLGLGVIQVHREPVGQK